MVVEDAPLLTRHALSSAISLLFDPPDSLEGSSTPEEDEPARVSLVHAHWRKRGVEHGVTHDHDHDHHEGDGGDGDGSNGSESSYEVTSPSSGPTPVA